MLPCSVQYVENTGIGIPARELRPQEAHVELRVVPHDHHSLQGRPDGHREIREPRGMRDIGIGDPVHVRGADGPVGLEAGDPLIDRAAVLVGADDRELDDPLVDGGEAGGLHVDHGEARDPRSARAGPGRGVHPATGDAIEQSHGSPFRPAADDAVIIAERADGQGRRPGGSARSLLMAIGAVEEPGHRPAPPPRLASSSAPARCRRIGLARPHRGVADSAGPRRGLMVADASGEPGDRQPVTGSSEMSVG